MGAFFIGCIKILAALVGCGIIAATAVITIVTHGGFVNYQWLVPTAIACGVAVGSIALAISSSYRQWWWVALFAVVLLAGELVQMASTAERVLAGRDAAAEPVRLATLKRKQAQQRLDDALSVHIVTTPRLDAAMTAKSKAEADRAADAAKQGCVKVCKQMHDQAVADAEMEVRDARADMEDLQRAAAREVDAAKAALDLLPPPKSETLLADKLHIDGSTLDLLIAALTSVGANGLGAALLAFGVHSGGHRREEKRSGARKITSTIDAVALPATDLPMPTISKISNDRAPIVLAANPEQHSAKFGIDNLKPSKKGRIALDDILAAYLDWCAAKQVPPLPARDITIALSKLFSETPGIGYEEDDNGTLFVTGVRLTQERPARDRVLTLIPDKNARLAG